MRWRRSARDHLLLRGLKELRLRNENVRLRSELYSDSSARHPPGNQLSIRRLRAGRLIALRVAGGGRGGVLLGVHRAHVET